MICPNCKKHLKNDVKFCNYCGEKLTNANEEHKKQYDYSSKYSKVEKEFDEGHEEQYNYSENYSDIYASKITSDEDYLKNYIGSNYETIKQEKPSLPALVFGSFYLLYRKMWLHALILLVISVLLIMNTNQDIFIFVQLLIQIYLCLKFNNIYIQYSSKKVDEIKLSNPDKTSKELLELCKKKGGVSFIFWIIPILLIIICLLVLTYKTEEKDNNDEVIINPITLKDMSYTINEAVNLSKYSHDSYNSYNYGDDYSKCHFRISVEQNKQYKNVDMYLKAVLSKYENEEMAYGNEKYTTRINWRQVKVYKEDNIMEYDYATIYKNNIYFIEVTICNDEKYTCNNIKKELLNSTKFIN